MAADKITLKIEYAKIGAALVMAATFIYSAGQLRQEVSDIRQELNYIRSKVDGIYIAPHKPITHNILTVGSRLEACLLNDEERILKPII